MNKRTLITSVAGGVVLLIGAAAREALIGVIGNAAWARLQNAGFESIGYGWGLLALVVALVTGYFGKYFKDQREEQGKDDSDDSISGQQEQLAWLGNGLFGISSVAGAIVIAVIASNFLPNSKPGSQSPPTEQTQGTKPGPEQKQGSSKPSGSSQTTGTVSVARSIFDPARLHGRIHVTLAAQGDSAGLQAVVDALGVPLDRQTVTQNFYRENVFDLMLQGDPAPLGGRVVPQGITRIVALKVDRSAPLKNNIPVDAIRITETVQIAIFDVSSNQTIYRNRFTVDGDGFDESFAQDSLREHLLLALTPVKAVLAGSQ